MIINWVLVALIAVILGAVVDIMDKERKNSAFAISLVFAVCVGVGYILKMLIAITG